jgi:hypothetical protein
LFVTNLNKILFDKEILYLISSIIECVYLTDIHGSVAAATVVVAARQR